VRKRLDQRQLGAVELAELFVAIHQRAELAGALLPVAAEQHPQVLHRRAHARVVQVHKVRAGAAQQARRPPASRECCRGGSRRAGAAGGCRFR